MPHWSKTSKINRWMQELCADQLRFISHSDTTCFNAFTQIFGGFKGLYNMNKFKFAAFAAALSLTAGAAQAEDLVFTLKNGTNSVLNNFYASPVGVDNWEDDIFGRQALGPGESMEITIADGRTVCEYDMRFEFQGDDLDTTTDTQNLCELGEYTIEE